ITHTSTNLPPDVRRAMARLLEHEQGARSAQALQVIAANIDMASDKEGPICQDTGWPTFEIKTPVGANQIVMKKEIRDAVAEATRRGKLRSNSVDSLAGENSGDHLQARTPTTHCRQVEHYAGDPRQLQLYDGGYA